MRTSAPPAGRRPFVAPRSVAVLVAIVAWGVMVGMGLWLRDSRDPTGVDKAVWNWLLQHTGNAMSTAMLALSDPILTVGGCAVVTICALLVRRWDVAVLAAVGPLVGLLLESHVFKPAFDRRYGIAETLSHGAVKAGYAYPSGHETGLTSLTSLLVILLLAGPFSRRVKITLTAVAVVWTGIGALGLVRAGYHYFTDTIGGIALGVGVMVLLALVIDVVAGRVSSPAGRVRTRTARAA